MNWFHLLTIIFVIAKLTGYATFSWLVVFLPSIFLVLLALFVIFIVALFTLISK